MTDARLSAYALPVSVGHDIVMEGHFPLSTEEWQLFLDVLEAMQVGLVRRENFPEPMTFE